MLDPREQAEAVAKWCGWETEARTKPSFVDPSKMIAAPPVWVHRAHGIRLSLPPYADSLDAMREVEDEIERRGLCMAYRRHLLEAVRERAILLWHSSAEPATFDCWAEYAIATATALQRLEAAARVIEEVSR